MMDVGERLVAFFQQQPSTEHTTTDLIKAMYPEEYGKIKAALHDPLTDKESRTVAKRHKGQLHRRLLYHLNNLIANSIISVTTTKGKGEKCYTLRQQPGIRGTQRDRVPATPLTQPLLKLEHYQQRKILIGLDPQGWHSRLNAILLDTSAEDTADSIHNRVANVAKSVNDVIGIHGMERLLIKEDLERISRLLRQLDIDTRDNNKTISLLVDLTNTTETKHAEDFFDAYALLHPPHVKLIMTITPKFLGAHQRLMKHIIKSFSDAAIKINLHNKEAHDAPILIGRAGSYTLSPQEWVVYLEEVKGKTIGLCLAQASVGVDVHRFFQDHRSDSSFREFILKLATTLVEANTQQRKQADTAFAELNSMNKSPHEFFRFSNNLIRLWNYDWQEKDRPHFIDLLTTTAEELERFCHTEETIFKSCGIPIRFKASLASMFSKFEPGFCSPRKYTKLTVTSSKALQQEELRSFIKARERISTLFNGNDRVRIFRMTPVDPDDVLRELHFLFTEHALPHLSYDFAERKAHLTLDQFIEA